MQTLEVIRAEVARVARDNGARLAVIFGSVARGTATAHSDIDVLFVEDTADPFLKRLDRYFDPLTDRLQAAVEVLVYTPREFERMVDSPFVKQAMAEGVVAYES
jgi:predicted nucleotidyltransferase